MPFVKRLVRPDEPVLTVLLMEFTLYKENQQAEVAGFFLPRSYECFLFCYLYLAGWAFLHSANNSLCRQVNQDIRAIVIQSHIVAVESDHAEVRHDSAAACKSQTLNQTRINSGNATVLVVGLNLLVVEYKNQNLQLIDPTGALPLRAAGVGADEDGQAQQTALRLGGVELAVHRRVVKQQLSVETDQLGTLIDTVRVWRLRGQHSILRKSDAKQATDN